MLFICLLHDVFSVCCLPCVLFERSQPVLVFNSSQCFVWFHSAARKRYLSAYRVRLHVVACVDIGEFYLALVCCTGSIHASLLNLRRSIQMTCQKLWLSERPNQPKDRERCLTESSPSMADLPRHRKTAFQRCCLKVLDHRNFSLVMLTSLHG
jgi:hypothetical protein